MATLTPNEMDIVRASPLFEGLPEEMLSRLLSEAHIASYSRNQLLFVHGETAKFVYLVLDGWIKIYRDTPEGEQTVIATLKTGETAAEAAIFLGKDYPASCEVISEARLLEFPAGPFLSHLREDSELALKMLGTMSKRLRNLILHIEQIQARSTSQRLAEFLLGLGDSGDGPAIIKLPYDKSLVAARLGMKPESLSRALAKLKKYGVATRGHDVEIIDVKGLREYCQGNGKENGKGSGPC